MRRPVTMLTLLALLLTALPGFTGTAEAADQARVVRGKVLKQLADGNRVAAPRIEVKLVHARRGVVAETFTRTDGLYHLRNVRHGRYEIQIEHRGETLRFAVVVDGDVEDVAPVILR